jgi:hypothetical protein
MTAITDRAFNAKYELGWDDANWDPSVVFTTDATAPHSPSSILRFGYPAGFAGSRAPGSGHVAVPNYRVLYESYWIRHSANFVGHLTGINKHSYAWAGSAPIFVMESEAAGMQTLHSRIALQSSAGSDAWYTQNLVPSATFTRGQWDYVEIVLTGNTAGGADGMLDWYMNGVHVGHYTGLRWTTGATAWNLFSLYPIWGGAGDVVPVNMYMDFDHFYLSGKN